MDGRGALKTEDGIGPVTSFTDTIPASWALSDVGFDFYGDAERGPYSLPSSSSSMGFMELLGVQGLGPSSLLDSAEAPDVHGAAAAVPTASVPPSPTASTPPESSSEVVNNLPTTPNSSSVSSAWNEALNKELKDHALEHEEDHDEKTQKQLKARKGNKKRQPREARVAFMTKSEVDHLEDGYRWRKYGQKAVKNSPYPRSYYRCTNAICNVKKRVERSFSDPSIVVTTYEGHHTHPSPNNILRDTCSHAAILSDSAAAAASLFATPTTTAALLPHHYYNINLQHPPRRPQSHFNALLSSPLNAAAYKTSPAAATTPASVFLGDHGLLQDVVPSTTMGKGKAE